jgi:hypothetical protein
LLFVISLKSSMLEGWKARRLKNSVTLSITACWLPGLRAENFISRQERG